MRLVEQEYSTVFALGANLKRANLNIFSKYCVSQRNERRKEKQSQYESYFSCMALWHANCHLQLEKVDNKNRFNKPNWIIAKCYWQHLEHLGNGSCDEIWWMVEEKNLELFLLLLYRYLEKFFCFVAALRFARKSKALKWQRGLLTEFWMQNKK